MSLIDRINANPLPFAQLLGIEFISAEADSPCRADVIRPDCARWAASPMAGRS